MRAPGADDDGSGTVTILEVFRTLLGSRELVEGKAENTIEFHWYSGEEAGLLGSLDVFSSYKLERKDVKAMLQQDMTGFVNLTVEAGQPLAFGLMVDACEYYFSQIDTSCAYLTADEPNLMEFAKLVIDEVGYLLRC